MTENNTTNSENGLKNNREDPIVKEVPKSKNKERETWSGRFDFFLAALGYAVGIGAIWRFPYLCYKNGGGVFLIPYFIFLFLVGIPLVFIELGVGQFTSTGPLTAWTMIPIFRGLGICMNIVNCYLGIYYNMIIAYSLLFLYLSLRTELPWSKCQPEWSSSNCIDNFDNFTKSNQCVEYVDSILCNKTLDYYYGVCISSSYSKINETNTYNASCITYNPDIEKLGVWKPTFPSEDYWIKNILQKSPSIDNSGKMVWQLVVALLIAWFIVFLTVIKGIKVHGKIVYFTTVFPYVVLLILGINAWILEGADKGILFYVTPDFSRLGQVEVWVDAATQIFFTLSVSYGGLIALSSYNNFDNNIMRDAIAVSVSNGLTSVYAGFVVFAYLGHLAHATDQEINDVVREGQGLSFIVFPYAVTLIPGSPFWSVLFFAMMVVIGLDTMMANVETTITSVLDVFPFLKRKKLRKYSTVIGVIIAYFLIGLIYTTQSGSYWVEIFDTYSGNWAVLIVGLLECISISWFYGIRRFSKDMSVMLGRPATKTCFYYALNVCWVIITPLLLIVLIFFVFTDLQPIPTYPYWSHILGQFLTASTLSGFFIWAFYAIFISIRDHKPLIDLFKADFESWKPSKKEHLDSRDARHKFTVEIDLDKIEYQEEKGANNMAFTYSTHF